MSNKVQPFNKLMVQPAKDTFANIKALILDEDSGVDAATAMVGLKKMAKVAELALKDPETKMALEEAVLLHKEDSATFHIGATKIVDANTTVWIMDECEDPVYHTLADIVKEATAQLKLRKEYLKVTKKAWESVNKPGEVIKFGLKPYVVTFERLPVFSWEEGAGEIHTNPPVELKKSQLRFSV